MTRSSRSTLLSVVGVLLSSSSLAAITGPTTSNGTFTLSWSNPPLGMSSATGLIDVTTGEKFMGQSANSGSKTFTLPNGTYDFEEEQCILIAPTDGFCVITDTHTVVVTGAPPPPPGPDHVVTRGDFNSDGQLDIAVVAPVGANRKIDDFILLNTGGGNYATLLSPTSTQITAARSATVISEEVFVGDPNLDFEKDVILKGMSGIDDLVVWSADSQTSNHPIRVLRLTQEIVDFVADTVQRFGDPGFFANAVTTQTITVAGWYVVDVFITSPGFAYDENGVWRYFDIGPATILLFLEIGETIQVLNPNVSGPAYQLGQRIDVLENGTVGQVADAVEEMLIILEDILNTDLGIPEVRPPWGNDSDAPGAIPGIDVVFDVLCEAIGAFCVEEAGSDVQLERILNMIDECEESAIVSGIRALLGSDDYRQPEVSAPIGQNYLITPSQRSAVGGSTQSVRRAFWVDRLNNSRDPVAPLAIDVVDDTFALGCLANRRYLEYAEEFGATDDLVTVGYLVLEAHVRATDREDSDNGPFVEGKLGPRQIADYHHQVFRDLGLPKKTFGGTPNGWRWQAKITSRYWCPSCDDDN